MKRFWLVAREANEMQTGRRHPTLEAAKAEAERLARKHPGNRFLVLELVGLYAPFNPPVVWQPAEDGASDELRYVPTDETEETA